MLASPPHKLDLDSRTFILLVAQAVYRRMTACPSVRVVRGAWLNLNPDPKLRVLLVATKGLHLFDCDSYCVRSKFKLYTLPGHRWGFRREPTV